MDDDLEPRLPPHEYCKGSYRDYIEAREGGVSKVASEEGNEEEDETHQSEKPEEDRQHDGPKHQRSARSVCSAVHY
jgi:hypothetical protein